jgi:hypothetical protein
MDGIAARKCAQFAAKSAAQRPEKIVASAIEFHPSQFVRKKGNKQLARD